MPRVSVLMPVYNTPENYLREAIDSILSQTYSDFEFIIINDGSTNNAEDVINSYKDERIVYIKNEENLKLIKTLNKGLAVAQGEYIIRMDSDDISLENRIEISVDFMDKHPQVAAASSYAKSYPAGMNYVLPTENSVIKPFCRYVANCMMHPGIIMRKSCLAEKGLRYDENYIHNEDYKLWIELNRDYELANIPEMLLIHRVHSDSVTAQYYQTQQFITQKLIFECLLEDFKHSKNIKPIVRKYFNSQMLSFSEYLKIEKFLYDALREIKDILYDQNYQASINNAYKIQRQRFLERTECSNFDYFRLYFSRINKLLDVSKNEITNLISYLMSKKLNEKPQTKGKILLVSQEKVLDYVNGATKMLYYFVKMFSENGYDVVVAYPNKDNVDVDPNLPSNVKFYNLNTVDMTDYKPKYKRFSLYEKLLEFICKKQFDTLKVKEYSKKIEQVIQIEQPNVIIPLFIHVTAQILYEHKYNIPIVQMYHTHPKVYHLPTSLFKLKLKKVAMIFNYYVKKIDVLQLFFESYKNYMKPYYKGRFEIIHNPVPMSEQSVDLTKEKKKIIYLSRIDRNKGQKELIEAFSMISNRYNDWQVLLYGDFEPIEYKLVIQKLIAEHNLQDQVKIMGITNNPKAAFMDADFGVYSSYFEGFPLGLSEALSMGLPCIGFETATGINELIVNQHNGLLCEYNNYDLARKMAEMISSQDIRIRMGEKAKESVKVYSEQSYFEKWDKLLMSVINKSN